VQPHLIIKIPSRIPILLLFSITATLCVRTARSAAMPQLAEIASANSDSVEDPKVGKDPFFPKSSRRAVQVVTTSTSTGPAPDVSAFAQIQNSLALKGVSGTAGKRLALINNRTLEVGEQTEFKINNQIIKIRCVEIRDKSVVIGLEGTAETKEIHLRHGT